MSPSGSHKSGPRVPLVRHFIACERIDRSPDGRRCSLINLLQVIRPAAGDAYPVRLPALPLFAQLTDGFRKHSFQVEVVFVDNRLEETVVHATSRFVRDLGTDPVALYGLPITVRNVRFDCPGLYECRLFCDGQEIAREPILLRDTP